MEGRKEIRGFCSGNALAGGLAAIGVPPNLSCPFNFLPIQSFFDSRIVPEVFFRCVVVTATVDMVAHAYAVREGNLSRLVDITGEAGFPAALRTDGLAARTVFLKMESVFGHDALFCGFLQVETVICSLQFLQSCRKYLFLEP